MGDEIQNIVKNITSFISDVINIIDYLKITENIKNVYNDDIKKLEDIKVERKKILDDLSILNQDNSKDKLKYDNLLYINNLKHRILNDRQYSKLDMEHYALKMISPENIKNKN